MRVLIVDDEPVALASVKRLLKRRGVHRADTCEEGRQAVELIKGGNYDVVLLDLLMPEVDGMQVLEAAKPFAPSTEFIILTAVDDLSMAVKAVRMGAYDYLLKPMDNERLLFSIQRAYERKGLRAGLAGTASMRSVKDVPEAFADTITQNARMVELLAYAEIMARGGNPVLITGESGTGKELLARGIHRAGPCPGGPFVAVNVSSVPEALFESQFFGHVKGAFTGAGRDHAGFFEQANGGTLFMDEIGELPLILQAKLLRVIDDQSIVPLGSQKPIQVEVRIVSATNVDLDQACQAGRFRLDLMYRLKSAIVHLPPLRERDGDILLLAHHYLQKAALRHGKEVREISSEARELLLKADYPGNVRELAQMIENAVLLTDSPIIQPLHPGKSLPVNSFDRRLCTLKEDRDIHVAYVLEQVKGDRTEAARILGVTVRQVQRMIAEMKKDTAKALLLGPVV